MKDKNLKLKVKKTRKPRQLKKAVEENNIINVKINHMDATLSADIQAVVEKDAGVVPASGLKVTVDVVPTTPTTETTIFKPGVPPEVVPAAGPTV